MGEKTKYNYSLLLGKMREKGFTQERLAKRLNLSAVSLNLSLNNKRPFKQGEMLTICEALGIDICDIEKYFFCKTT